MLETAAMAVVAKTRLGEFIAEDDDDCSGEDDDDGGGGKAPESEDKVESVACDGRREQGREVGRVFICRAGSVVRSTPPVEKSRKVSLLSLSRQPRLDRERQRSINATQTSLKRVFKTLAR